MKRKLLQELLNWIDKPRRKPLILRGARQTGKTYIIRQLAEASSRKLIEINFERNPEISELFKSNNPKKIISDLELLLNIEIDFEECLLFLDEVQDAAFILEKLRWFYEETPELPVVCAGSLLEFALEEFNDSLPVGRVTYMYLHPFSFIEFLWAVGEQKLASYLEDVRINLEMPEAIHNRCIELFRLYCIVGGMPDSINEWVQSKNLSSCIKIQKDIVVSYRDDFNKYRKGVAPDVMRNTMDSIPYQMGHNFVYSTVNREEKYQTIKNALDKLSKAGICKRIYHSSGNGIPLGAEKNDRIFKALFLDCGLALSILGLLPISIEQLENIIWSDKGAFAEQVSGQLLYSKHSIDDDDLFFWQQTGSGNGEIDYLIQKDNEVLPVEVKSGVAGSMKSLHSFMESKKLKTAIRLDLNKPSIQEVSVKTNQGKAVSYKLISLPLYMAELL
ncbi:MAG: ATP-binding protein [Sphaerochaetaceae bacterium]|nr:ATP-binding protein [Sphaerochaetaceae bacterium]